MKHPLNIEGFSLEELACRVGNLRYDKTIAFLELLADDISRQADGDLLRGRYKLAMSLYLSAEKLYDTCDVLYTAWDICEPYMR